MHAQVYCATKWAVEAFLQGLRQETAGTNIRVCSIQPGATESELASHIQDPDVLAAPKYEQSLFFSFFCIFLHFKIHLRFCDQYCYLNYFFNDKSFFFFFITFNHAMIETITLMHTSIVHLPSIFKGVRILSPEDVAHAVLYTLCQPSYVSTNEGASRSIRTLDT